MPLLYFLSYPLPVPVLFKLFVSTGPVGLVGLVGQWPVDMWPVDMFTRDQSPSTDSRAVSGFGLCTVTYMYEYFRDFLDNMEHVLSPRAPTFWMYVSTVVFPR